MAYRISRNLEASLIDYIREELEDAGWADITVEKIIPTDISLPTICVRLSDTAHNYAELGSNATMRTPLVLIDIFGSNDGNRLDLKDFLISILKGGCPYYEYTIVNNVASKTQNGRITVTNIADTPVDLNVPKSDLDLSDRWRHLLSITIDLERVES